MLERLIRRVRKNHALEHATVTILLEKGIRPPLGGYSTPGGFFIVGRIPTDVIASASSEALGRLNQGQRELAISPYCGTNLATGALLAGIFTRIVMWRKKGRLRRVPLAVLAAVGATALGRPVGNALQRKYTTLAETEGMEITRVTSLGASLHRISTRTRN